jgi:hypothetical protein
MHRDGIARTLILLEGGAVHAVQIALDSFGVPMMSARASADRA